MPSEISSHSTGRFRIGFLVATTVLAFTIVIALISLRDIAQGRQDLAQGDDYMQFSLDLMILRNNLSRQRVLVREMMLVDNRAQIEQRHQTIKQLTERNHTILKSMTAYSAHTPELAASAKQIQDIYLDVEAFRSQRVIPLIYAGKDEEAEALSLGRQNANVTKLRAIADPLLETALERHFVKTTVADSEQAAGISFLYIMLICATVLMCITIIYVALAPSAPRETVS